MITKIKRVLKRAIKTYKSNKNISKLPKYERDLIEKIKSRKLTYLSNEKLVSLLNTLREVNVKNINGILIEAGCALGGSSILIASAKKEKQTLNVYDVFGMIPPPTVEDTKDVHERYQDIVGGNSKGLGGDEYYGYQKDLIKTVESNFNEFGINLNANNVHLVKGLVQDTLEIEEPVALAHIDVDWYEPVMTSLVRIYPKLVIGGSIILDDYHDWGGCRKAADEFLKGYAGKFALDDSARSMKITKIAE